MFLRRLVAGLLITAILSGCATTLPKKSEVDYVLDENGKPEIIQPDDESLSQTLFEIKINEIKAKSSRFILSDTIKAEIISKANGLLIAQQEYFLKNEDRPRKAGIISVIVTTLGLVVIRETAKDEFITSGGQYYNGFNVDYGDGDGVYILSSIALVCPLTYIAAYYLGKKIGKNNHNMIIKSESRVGLHRLIAEYNGTIKGQLE